MNNSLNSESEFRYIIQWFRDFSEYEKSDFQEVLLKWLLNKNEAAQVNGINENCSTKPTIFACRVKLFKEWSSRWPDPLRSKLVDKLNDLDSDFGQKLNESLEALLENNVEETTVSNHNNNTATTTDDIVPSIEITNGYAVNGEKEAVEEETLQNGITALSVNEE